MADVRFSHLRTNIAVRLDHKAGRVFQLGEPLCAFRLHTCADARDKVYSLLGLLPCMPSELSVDYGHSVTEVLLEVTRVTLLRDKNINVLSHATNLQNDRYQSLGPSWLPTYNINVRHDRPPFLPCDKTLWTYRAGGEAEAHIEQLELAGCEWLLGVRGFFVDDVAVPYMHQGDEPFHGREQFSTSSGAMGLGPGRLRVGDVVVVFGGGPVPYILRKEDPEAETWTFIGEWYVCQIKSCLRAELTCIAA
jgi:hypothetical protein